MKTLFTDLKKKRSGKKPLAEPSQDDGANKPKRAAVSARKTKADKKEADAKPDVVVEEEEQAKKTISKQPKEEPKGRATRSKAKDKDEEESKGDTTVGTTDAVIVEPKKNKAAIETKIPSKTRGKEAPKSDKPEAKPAAALGDDKKDKETQSMEEIEAGMSSMNIRDDAGETSKRRFSRFGRKLGTPTKYKDYILGAARRKNNANVSTEESV